jgi:hypothetical protein
MVREPKRRRCLLVADACMSVVSPFVDPHIDGVQTGLILPTATNNAAENGRFRVAKRCQ